MDSFLGILLEDPADNLGRVIHHGNNPGIIQSGWPDDSERTHHALLVVAVGSDDHGRAGKGEKLVLRADENAHAIAALRQLQQSHEVFLCLQFTEQLSYPVQLFCCFQIAQQVGMATYDQLALLDRWDFRPKPQCLNRQAFASVHPVHLLRCASRDSKLLVRFSDRSPCNFGVEKI